MSVSIPQCISRAPCVIFGLCILCHAICYTVCKGRRESNPAVRTVAPHLRLFPFVGTLPSLSMQSPETIRQNHVCLTSL
jgi:hypothetical protein